MPKNTGWDQDKKTVKSVQIAFELEQNIAQKIQIMAAQDGLTPSSQIRKLIGLDYAPPKRPRLTLSLSAQDYDILAEKYHIQADDKIAIKRYILNDLMTITDKKDG